MPPALSHRHSNSGRLMQQWEYSSAGYATLRIQHRRPMLGMQACDLSKGLERLEPPLCDLTGVAELQVSMTSPLDVAYKRRC